MLNHAKDFLYTRSRQDNHQQSIRNDSSKLTDDVSNIVDTIFAHLPAVYGIDEPDPFPDSEAEESRIPSTEWIAWNFYKKHYCNISLNRDFRGKAVTTKAFLKSLTHFGASSKRNNLFFLQGEIGSGKTAFINYLITNFGHGCFNEEQVWYLRVNVDAVDHTAQKDVDPVQDFFEKSALKLIRIVRKVAGDDSGQFDNLSTEQVTQLGIVIEILEKALDHEGKKSEAKLNIVRDAFVGAIQEINSILNRRMLFILDNLDAFFHERDRYLFLSDIDTGEDYYVRAIQKIVGEFYHGASSVGDLGVNALFVLRRDSYEILKTSKLIYQGTEDPYKDNRSLFTLHTPDWKDVVMERSNLLQLTIENIPREGIRRSVDRALEDVTAALSDAKKVESIVGHLQQIVTFGLRSVMNFFQQYTWLNTVDDNPISPTARYIENIPVGLICFILQNKRLFSQKGSGFPNIYYVNIDRDEEYAGNEEIIQPITAEKLNSQHDHTYWLKRLLLLLIEKRNENQQSIKTRDVVDIFSTDNGYDPSLVRLCLGSFSQTHLSNLCHVKRQLSNDQKRLIVGDILLTDRARYCLHNLFDKFAYLQLIVDDHDLPLPNHCKKKFLYRYDSHYGYMVADGDEYSIPSRDMVSLKSELVTKFMAILSVANECEMEKYPRVFSKLVGEGIVLPNPDQNFSKVLNELRNLKGAPLSHNPASNVEIHKLRDSFHSWKKELTDDIRNAYGLG